MQHTTREHLEALAEREIRESAKRDRLVPRGSDPANWDGTHIEFTIWDPDPKKKTFTWEVVAKRGGIIGTVKWFARWRKYCFFPAADCVFEETCLGEIAEFIVARTREHKEGL